jgi:hypothetical protein
MRKNMTSLMECDCRFWNGGASESSDEVNKQVAGDREGTSIIMCVCLFVHLWSKCQWGCTVTHPTVVDY